VEPCAADVPTAHTVRSATQLLPACAGLPTLNKKWQMNATGCLGAGGGCSCVCGCIPDGVALLLPRALLLLLRAPGQAVCCAACSTPGFTAGLYADFKDLLMLSPRCSAGLASFESWNE